MLCRVILSIFALFVGLSAAPVRAQNTPAQAAANPVVRLVPAGVQTLADALRSISQQTGAAFVCEGKPFRVRNLPAPLLPVIAKWPQNGLPLNDAVSQIADAYDYEAEQNGNVFLLRKRYTNPRDLPDLPAEELRLSLRDAVRASSDLFVPDISEGKKQAAFVQKFYQTLTPAQIRRLTGGDDGRADLPVSALTPAQKQMIQGLVLRRHIETITGGPEKMLTALREYDQTTTAFGEAMVRGGKSEAVRALCCLVRENGKTAPVPFAPTSRVRFDFFERIVFPVPHTDAPLDRTAPTPLDFGTNGDPLPPPEETGPNTYSLQTLADALKPSRFAAHEALAQKSVTVVGITTDNAEAIWRAAGLVYGFRAVRTEEGGPLLLLRPRARVARTFAELNEAVFSAFPFPLIRLCQGADEAADKAAKVPKRAPLTGNDAADMETLEAELRASIHALLVHEKANQAVQEEALRRFRVWLDAPLKASNSNGTGRVLYRDLPPKAHDLWTLALMIAEMRRVSKIQNEPLPLMLTDFDKGYLWSRLNDGDGSRPPVLEIAFSVHTTGYSTAEVGRLPMPNSPPAPTKGK